MQGATLTHYAPLVASANVTYEYRTPTFTSCQPYVLVVDDDHAILSVILLLLETEGYDAFGILDSRQVLPFLERIHKDQSSGVPVRLPTLILLDLMMPHLSGFQIAAELALCEWSKAIPVVAMTADPTVQNPETVRGVHDLICKPFQLDEVLDKVACYLPSNRLMQ